MLVGYISNKERENMAIKIRTRGITLGIGTEVTDIILCCDFCQEEIEDLSMANIESESYEAEKDTTGYLIHKECGYSLRQIYLSKTGKHLNKWIQVKSIKIETA